MMNLIKLRHWCAVLGLLVVLGVVQVMERTSRVYMGYSLAESSNALHGKRTELAWTQTQVTRLGSPSRLARANDSKKLGLMAWSIYSPQEVPESENLKVAMAGHGQTDD